MKEYDARYPERGGKFSPSLLAYEKEIRDPIEVFVIDEDSEPWRSMANRIVKQYAPVSVEVDSCSWPCCMVGGAYWSYGWGNTRRALNAG